MLPPPDEKAIHFCILISNTFFEKSKYALPNLLFRKTSLIYTWSSFSLSSAGKISGVNMAYISVSHVFPLIANINVFQLWTLQLESHLGKPSSASLLYSSRDQRMLISRFSTGKAGAPRAWHNTIPFGLVELINSILIPNTLQQCFPVFFPPQGPAVPLNVTSPLPLCPSSLGQGGCLLPPRGPCVTRHGKGSKSGTCHASIAASPVRHEVHFVGDTGTAFHLYVKRLQRVQK